eukprot:PhF_6_TR35800/c0_g2_i1/m.52032
MSLNKELVALILRKSFLAQHQQQLPSTNRQGPSTPRLTSTTANTPRGSTRPHRPSSRVNTIPFTERASSAGVTNASPPRNSKTNLSTLNPLPLEVFLAEYTHTVAGRDPTKRYQTIISLFRRNRFLSASDLSVLEHRRTLNDSLVQTVRYEIDQYPGGLRCIPLALFRRCCHAFIHATEETATITSILKKMDQSGSSGSSHIFVPRTGKHAIAEATQMLSVIGRTKLESLDTYGIP